MRFDSSYLKPRAGMPDAFGLWFLDNTAVGDESQVINDELKQSVDHYMLPFSRVWADPAKRFQLLKSEWESATAVLSSVSEMSMHPAYQQIIGMGPIALPFIFSELNDKPGHWFWALRSIAGEDPVLPEQRGRIKQMAATWIQWGRKHGYLT